MPASEAVVGIGTILKMGDGGVGAGVKAYVEWGTSNAKIRVKRKIAGTAGNGKNVTVAVSGSSFITTSITASEVSITAPTTATVAMVVAYLYQNTTFTASWEADYGATPGDGTGTITARTVTATASGAEGTEIFTAVAEVKSIQGPSASAQLVEVTHMGSENRTREYKSGLIDPGEVTFNCNLIADDPTQVALRAALIAGTTHNFRQELTDASGSYISFAAIVTGIGDSFEMEQAAMSSITLKVTGPATLTTP